MILIFGLDYFEFHLESSDRVGAAAPIIDIPLGAFFIFALIVHLIFLKAGILFDNFSRKIFGMAYSGFTLLDIDNRSLDAYHFMNFAFILYALKSLAAIKWVNSSGT